MVAAENHPDTAHASARKEDPSIITGGMGVWISNWSMARVVSLLGGMGIV